MRGEACAYCGEPFADKDGQRGTKDHIVPKRLGGAAMSYNVVRACRECNNIKGDMTIAAILEVAEAADRYAARLRMIAGRVESLMSERGLSL